MTEKLTEPNGAEVTVRKSPGGGVRIEKCKPGTKLVMSKIVINGENIDNLILAIGRVTGREIE